MGQLVKTRGLLGCYMVFASAFVLLFRLRLKKNKTRLKLRIGNHSCKMHEVEEEATASSPLTYFTMGSQSAHTTHSPQSSISNGNMKCQTPKEGRRLEVLVHNISHKDMVLNLGPPDSPEVIEISGSSPPHHHGGGPHRPFLLPGVSSCGIVVTRQARNDDDSLILARPKFSLFRPTSSLIKSHMSKPKCVVSAAEFPVYRTLKVNDGTTERCQKIGEGNTSSKEEEYLGTMPVGFDLSADPIGITRQDLLCFKVRTKDLQKISFLDDIAEGKSDANSGSPATLEESETQKNKKRKPDLEEWHQNLLQPIETKMAHVVISGVYFPLLSVLVPKWKRHIEESGVHDCRKVIILVSGVGVHRESNGEISLDNSTEITAQLMEDFLMKHYTDIHVMRLHSTTNLFRYDENIQFVNHELLPVVEKERNALSLLYGAEWRNMMNLTVSFADGSPARISAINASLRPYRPTFMHIWELKTLWNEGRVSEDDVEVHTFEDIETAPAIPVGELGGAASLLLQRLQLLRDSLVAAKTSGTVNDLTSFWLRKTKKPVLAALLVQKPGSTHEIFCGTNMEVSMPTGSLCAERSAIGSALSSDFLLRRHDIKMIAVLGMPTLDRLWDTTVRQQPVPLESGVISALDKWRDGEEKERQQDMNLLSHTPSPLLHEFDPVMEESEQSCDNRRRYNGKELTWSPKSKYLHSQAESDPNPLKPCGSCMEWLKKIAEVNPSFKILTFTDICCNGVFVESVVQAAV
eukprot:435175_1